MLGNVYISLKQDGVYMKCLTNNNMKGNLSLDKCCLTVCGFVQVGLQGSNVQPTTKLNLKTKI
jgi:hypothetical protein